MNFEFTQEQQQFSDALQRWMEKDYTFEHRKKIILSEAGISPDAWNTLVELGVTALAVPEEQGGFGGSAIDMMVVMKEIGRGLVIEPLFATALGAQFLKLAGNQGNLLEHVATGKLKLAAAIGEKQARFDLFDIKTTATVIGEGYLISGTKVVVLHGGQADQLIISARSSGQPRDTNGISLFVVPANAAGVSCRDYRTIDGQRAADIRLENVQVPASALLGAASAGWDILDAAADYGATLLCAEAIGAMEALNTATLEYLKTRQQFGVPIGKFQALQHRMAEMFMQYQQASSMATLAAVKVASGDAAERRRTVSAAKARVGQAAKFVGQQAVQLHGGMGVTNELPAAHHFKRLSMIEQTLGDTDYHLARFISQPGFSKTA